jgi:hypothetical protein
MPSALSFDFLSFGYHFLRFPENFQWVSNQARIVRLLDRDPSLKHVALPTLPRTRWARQDASMQEASARHAIHELADAAHANLLRRGWPMRNRFEQAQPGGFERETIDQPSSTAAGPPHACVHGRKLFACTQSRLTTETQTLLRFRLRAAMLILLTGFGIFLARHVIGVLTGEPVFRVLMGFHVLVVLVLCLSEAWLWRRSDLSTWAQSATRS